MNEKVELVVADGNASKDAEVSFCSLCREEKTGETQGV